jgi:UDP-N-acetylglucosamine 2-epimerase (non-hydrolysing)
MKIMLVAGARPNFMKIAPLLEALTVARKALSSVNVLLVHTGQHYDESMSGTFFQELGIRAPDFNLQVGSGSHAEQTARIMLSFEPLCLSQQPDWVVVVGDVNSTIACALTATKLGIRVAHVEAGLRSRDRSMPEEINRICTDSIADALFTTERSGGENLLAEGIPPEKIHFVGNTMIDTLIRQRARALAYPLPPDLHPGQYAALTLHRPANVDRPEVLRKLLDALLRVADRIPIVFPAHPRTLKNLDRFSLRERISHPSIHVVSPMSYLEFIGLVARSRMVLTDSGGIQEETTYLGVPCLTMRDNTERPITCTVGTNRLVGSDPRRIIEEAFAVLDGTARVGTIPEKWDGHASERIAEILLSGSSSDHPTPQVERPSAA